MDYPSRPRRKKRVPDENAPLKKYIGQPSHTPQVATMKIEMENGITIMAAGSIIEGDIEFYELAGVMTEDNILEIFEKFKELYNESRIGLN